MASVEERRILKQSENETKKTKPLTIRNPSELLAAIETLTIVTDKRNLWLEEYRKNKNHYTANRLINYDKRMRLLNNAIAEYASN